MENVIKLENKVLFEKPYLRIEYDREFHGLLTIWNGKLEVAEFKTGIDNILKNLRELELTKIINDPRKLEVLPVEAQNYAVEQVQKFCAIHYSFKQAHLIPPDPFVKFAVDNVSKKIDKDAIDEVNDKFYEKHEAIEWLNS